MRKLLTALLAAALLLSCACAQEMDSMPQDVLEHIRRVYAEPEIEDYLALPDMVDGVYGFALVRNRGVRTLLGYRWRDGEMENWLSSETAVPQTDRKASLYHYEKGTVISYLWDHKNEYRYVTRGHNFGVSVPDQWHETTESHVYYEWESRSFRLKSYRDHFWDADILGDTFYFWDIGNGLRNVVDTDIWVDTSILGVDLKRLPKRADDLSQRAYRPPSIPVSYEEGALQAQTYDFETDRKYPVYNGPGKQYSRAGDGKASVSTNDWIQVFGEYKGFLMIQYALSDTRCRIGWITRDALPRERYVQQLEFAQEDVYTLSEAQALTDDPLCSHTALCTLPQNAQVKSMARLGYAWTYVCVEHEGMIWWGFLPSDLLEGA